MAGSTTADLKVVGPIGVDPSTQVFPANNPFTFVTITDTQFSDAGAFVQQSQVTFQDAVDARRGVGTPIPTGEYDVTTRCLNRLGNQAFGTYVGGPVFRYSDDLPRPAQRDIHVDAEPAADV